MTSFRWTGLSISVLFFSFFTYTGFIVRVYTFFLAGKFCSQCILMVNTRSSSSKIEAVPSPWWTSRSTTKTRLTFPVLIKYRETIAMSFIMQNPVGDLQSNSKHIHAYKEKKRWNDSSYFIRAVSIQIYPSLRKY